MADYRLPTTVRPTHYQLAVKTDLAATPPSFAAEAIIDLAVDETTSSIVFNLHPSLSVTHIALASGDLGATAIPTSALSVDAETERATLDIGAVGAGLAAGVQGAKLFVRWEAELGGNMMGYYKSNGDADEHGNRPIYALTQFEPTAARRAMPCWDEPLHKATYALSMIAREGQVVLANMDAVSIAPWQPAAPLSSSEAHAALDASYKIGSTLPTSSAGAWTITQFTTTPPMSTYLVAFACGDFAHLAAEHHSKLTGKTIPLKIYATANQIHKAQLGLDVKKWGLPIYEELFDIPYPLPKLDTLVAHDFDMGAMENWGLITGRTTAYLYDERSSLAAKKRVGTVQLHELAHMWFGDIVTMKWWDNLWLNEAFATLMGSLVLPERIFPEWKMNSEFIDTHWVRAMDLDCRRSSHPIEVACPDSSQINQIFDAISYSKGASVLRMLKSVVGEEKFFKGVSIYLKKHLYSNAQSSDLWEGISQSVGKDMGSVMANWTLRVGFPVITVEENGDGELKLTQNRFLSTNDVKADENETIWWVPLEVKTVNGGKTNVEHDAILSDRSATYKVSSDSFKLNAETIGLYRVKYTPERLVKLGAQAQSFTVDDRVGLLSDASALASAGYSKTSAALAFAAAVAATETEYLPFSQISNLLGTVARVWWEDDEVHDAINRVRASIFRPLVDKMGYEHAQADSPDVKQLRALAVSTAAAAGDETVLAEIVKRFEPFSAHNDDSGITPDLQRTIFTKAVREGGKAEYEKMLEVYNSASSNPSTKVDAMFALCATQDPALIDRTFAMLPDTKAIKDQDLYIFFTGLGANRAVRHRNAEYVMDNWVALNERYNASFGLRNAIGGAFGKLSSKHDLERVSAFFGAHDVKKYKLVVAQTIEGIQAASDWLSRDTEDVKAWLKDNRFL